jgi:hypothetical protein
VSDTRGGRQQKPSVCGKEVLRFNANEKMTKDPEKGKRADILTKIQQRKQASKGKPAP